MIPIKNIYHMLSYAFRCLNEGAFKALSDEKESFECINDLYAEILILGVSTQIKRGLLRGYIDVTESLKRPHGKIEITESIKAMCSMKRELVCSFQEYNENHLLNQILKQTFTYLLCSKGVSCDRKKKIRKILSYFCAVETIDLHSVDWNIQFNRCNKTYQMLIYICHWIYEEWLFSHNSESKKMREYKDDQKLSRLYEKFVLEYFRREHPSLNAKAPHLKWQLDDGVDAMLPIMKTDVTLERGGKILVIDTKFYNSMLQRTYDSRTQHSHNMYQIFTYVKNMASDRLLEGKIISGLLLYARTNEKIAPDQDYSMSGNRISVKSLDLNKDFVTIKAQLDAVVSMI